MLARALPTRWFGRLLVLAPILVGLGCGSTQISSEWGMYSDFRGVPYRLQQPLLVHGERFGRYHHLSRPGGSFKLGPLPTLEEYRAGVRAKPGSKQHVVGVLEAGAVIVPRRKKVYRAFPDIGATYILVDIAGHAGFGREIDVESLLWAVNESPGPDPCLLQPAREAPRVLPPEERLAGVRARRAPLALKPGDHVVAELFVPWTRVRRPNVALSVHGNSARVFWTAEDREQCDVGKAFAADLRIASEGALEIGVIQTLGSSAWPDQAVALSIDETRVTAWRGIHPETSRHDLFATFERPGTEVQRLVIPIDHGEAKWYPKLTRLAGNRVLFTWHGLGDAGPAGRIFTVDGRGLTADLPILPPEGYGFGDPTFVATEDGGFLGLWVDEGRNTFVSQRFSSNGTHVGGFTKFEHMGYPWAPSLHPADDGSFALLWAGERKRRESGQYDNTLRLMRLDGGGRPMSEPTVLVADRPGWRERIEIQLPGDDVLLVSGRCHVRALILNLATGTTGPPRTIRSGTEGWSEVGPVRAVLLADGRLLLAWYARSADNLTDAILTRVVEREDWVGRNPRGRPAGGLEVGVDCAGDEDGC